MPTYAALLWEGRDKPRDPSAPSFAEYMAGYMNFSSTADEAISGGAALMNDELSTTFHLEDGLGGEVVMTDGPYAETKEFLGGFFLIDASDLDAAIDIAKNIPCAWDGGRVEIRPCMEMP